MSENSSSPTRISCFCEGGDIFADASLVEAHAPLAIERDMPASPKAGKALLRRLPMEERFGMAQLLHTELNWRDEIRPSCADPGGGQACSTTPNVDASPPMGPKIHLSAT